MALPFSHFADLSTPCSAGLGLGLGSGSGSREIRSLSLGLLPHLPLPHPPTAKPAWTGKEPLGSPFNPHQEWRARGLLACEMSPPATPGLSGGSPLFLLP